MYKYRIAMYCLINLYHKDNSEDIELKIM